MGPKIKTSRYFWIWNTFFTFFVQNYVARCRGPQFPVKHLKNTAYTCIFLFKINIYWNIYLFRSLALMFLGKNPWTISSICDGLKWYWLVVLYCYFNSTSPAITPVTGRNVPLPCGFSVLKGQDSNIRTAGFYDWGWLRYHMNFGNPGVADKEDYCSPSGGSSKAFAISLIIT